MKKFVLGAAATLCLALTSGSTLAQPGPGPDQRVEQRDDHRVDHRRHHRHEVCHMRHHHRVCHWE